MVKAENLRRFPARSAAGSVGAAVPLVRIDALLSRHDVAVAGYEGGVAGEATAGPLHPGNHGRGGDDLRPVHRQQPVETPNCGRFVIVLTRREALLPSCWLSAKRLRATGVISVSRHAIC